MVDIYTAKVQLVATMLDNGDTAEDIGECLGLKPAAVQTLIDAAAKLPKPSAAKLRISQRQKSMTQEEINLRFWQAFFVCPSFGKK